MNSRNCPSRKNIYVNIIKSAFDTYNIKEVAKNTYELILRFNNEFTKFSITKKYISEYH